MPLLMFLNQEQEPLDDKIRDVQRPRRGDCVGVFPDDWQFGALERNNPMFSIVKVPGTVKDYATLVESEQTSVDLVHGTLKPWRKMRVDLDAVLKVEGVSKTDAKVGQFYEATAAAPIMAAAKVAPTVEDDRVIR